VLDEDQSGTISREEFTKVVIHHHRKRLGLGEHKEMPPLWWYQEEEGEEEEGRPLLNKEGGGGGGSGGGGNDDDGPPPLPLQLRNTTSIMDPDEDEDTTTTTTTTSSSSSGGGGGGGDLISSIDVRMCPDAYELAHRISVIFDWLDANGDGEISLEEFLQGTRDHPELIEWFLNNDGEEEGEGERGSPPCKRRKSDGEEVVVATITSPTTSLVE